jgi:PAS domain S-box-containing protein
MQSGSLRRARIMVFALALGILAAIAYLANRDYQDYLQSRTEGQAASQTTLTNERLLGWVRDAENGERGYLITGRAEYLAPYRQAIHSIQTDLATLRELQANHPQRLARVNELGHIIDEKLDEMRDLIELHDSRGAAAAIAALDGGLGTQLMDEIRALSGQIQSAANDQLVISRNATRRHAAQARLVTLVGCGLLLVILLGAFMANERAATQREKLIGELADANRESSEVRDLLRTTFYSIADGVITTDSAGRVQLMNSMAERLSGWTEKEARGKPVEEVFHTIAEGSRLAPANPVRAALNGASTLPTAAPMKLSAKGGSECTVEVGGSAIRDASGESRGAVLVFRDISDRMQTEERLRQAAKLESLGVLAGGIAHDFNNLLVGIVGNASMLEEYFSPGSQGRDLVESLQASGTRAARLTNQMLAYSGRGRFVVRAVDLSNEVQEIASLVSASIPKKVELRLSTGSGLPPIDADAAQLQQLIMNLVINGAEAVGDQPGFVEVSTSLQRIAAAAVTDVLKEPVAAGRYVVLSVTDSGQGMDEATRSKIFDPFFTTKFTGRGLGLAAVLGIVKGHSGAIEVQSAPGKGSAFRVYFPADEAGARSGHA